MSDTRISVAPMLVDTRSALIEALHQTVLGSDDSRPSQPPELHVIEVFRN